jgi:hypothetical protein
LVLLRTLLNNLSTFEFSRKLVIDIESFVNSHQWVGWLIGFGWLTGVVLWDRWHPKPQGSGFSEWPRDPGSGVACDLPDEIRRPNPLYVDFPDDHDSWQWDPVPIGFMGCCLMIACIHNRTGRAPDLKSSL